MAYHVVRIDTSSSNSLSNGGYREVSIWGSYDDRQEARKAADRSNSAQGPSQIEFFVISDDDIQEYNRRGTRVIRSS